MSRWVEYLSPALPQPDECEIRKMLRTILQNKDQTHIHDGNNNEQWIDNNRIITLKWPAAKQDISGPKDLKLFFMLNSAQHKIYPTHKSYNATIVVILTFISMINTTSERLKARKFFTFPYFSFYEQLKFRTQLSWVWKKFYNQGGQFSMVRVCCCLFPGYGHGDVWVYWYW